MATADVVRDFESQWKNVVIVDRVESSWGQNVSEFFQHCNFSVIAFEAGNAWPKTST